MNDTNAQPEQHAASAMSLEEHSRAWDNLIHDARAAFEEARYADAERDCKAALEHAEAVGYQDARFIATLSDLGEIYRSQGRYSAAEPVLLNALALCREMPASTQTVQVMNNLAAVCAVQGKLGEAEQYYREALATAETVLEPDDGALGASLNNLALLYKTQNNYAAAAPLFQRAMRIWLKVLGPQHPLIATSLNNFGAICHAEGKLAEAEALFRQSLQIKEKALGPQHAEVATILNNLGEVCLDEQRYAEARDFFERLLILDEAALGASHPEIASDLSRLALACEGEGRDDEAEPLYRRALEIREAALGPQHAQVAKTLQKLAAVCRRLSRVGEADALSRRAAAIPGSTPGPKAEPSISQAASAPGPAPSPQPTPKPVPAAAEVIPAASAVLSMPAQPALEAQTIAISAPAGEWEAPVAARSLVELADRYAGEGRLVEAEKLYEGALTIERSLLGPVNVAAGITAGKLGSVLKAQGKRRQAARMFQESLAIWMQLPDDAGVASSLNNLATVCAAAPDAAALYAQSLAIWRRTALPNDPRLQVVASNLAALG